MNNKPNIHIVNPHKFHKETLDFYRKFCEETTFEKAEFIITTNFDPIEITGNRKVHICSNTTGYDHINISKAPNAEIISLRGEDLSDITAVAELTLGMMIMLTRLFKNEEIKGKTLGLIGYGRIAKQLEVMARNMGMHILAHDKGSKRILKDVLEYSDIISLHITADEENRNFIDKQMFKRMRDGAVFLNSARPWLVDIEVLRWALRNKLSVAWFDFTMPFQEKNLITTNHLGGSTKQSRAQTEQMIAEKVIHYKLI